MNSCLKHPGWIAGCEKSKLTNKLRRQQKIEQYTINPTRCVFCSSSLPYDKRNNKFCNSVCAGHLSTKGKKHTEETKKKISLSLCSNQIFIDEMKSRQIFTTIKCIVCNSEYTYRGRYYKRVLCDNLECKQKFFSDVAKKNSCFHGNKNKHSKWYNSKFAGKVFLESTWEELLAKDLDLSNIVWIKPINCFLWFDCNNKQHRYYPDFYIPSLDVYVDPKNPYIYQFDKYKIDSVMNKYKIKVVVITEKNNLNYNYIAGIAQFGRAPDL